MEFSTFLKLLADNFSWTASLVIFLLFYIFTIYRRHLFKPNIEQINYAEELRNVLPYKNSRMRRYNPKNYLPPVSSQLENQALNFPEPESLRQAMLDIMKQYRVPGALVSVRKRGELVAEFAIGKSRLDGKEPMTLDMFFRIGSVTKTMTATLVLILVEQGKLSLDDRLAKWLPEFENSENITVLEMLNMTSGLGEYVDNQKFAVVFVTDPEIHWQSQDLLRWSQEQESRFKPRSSWMYTNTNYLILGQIIKQITGLSLDRAFSTYLFKPLGMKNSFVAASSFLPYPHPQGYANFRQKFENVTNWNPTWGKAAVAVFSCLSDMHRWSINLGNSILLKSYKAPADILLNQSSVDSSAQSTRIFERDQYFYGLGILYDHQWLLHNGSVPGFETVCAYYRPLDLSVVISLNQTTLPEFKVEETVVTQMFRRVVELYTPLSKLHLAPH